MKTIIAEGIGKTYRIQEPGAGYRTLRDQFVGALRGRKAPMRDFEAVKDVSFEAGPGDVLALLGRNGSGKSTTLKILSRIVEPTRGRVIMKGRVASLLEVGAGFHPDLTGRENVFVNGAILGMSRREVAAKLEAIVEFSECGPFLDTPVKRFSSGMYTRLAFSVAAHLDPDILLVDEVLAVGDAAFQKKCLGRLGEAAREGRTVVFVSHSMPAVQALCNKALLLKQGRVEAFGPAAEVISLHAAAAARGGTTPEELDRMADALPPTGPARIARVRFHDAGRPASALSNDGDVDVEILVEVSAPVSGLRVAIDCLDAFGSPVWRSAHDEAFGGALSVIQPGLHPFRARVSLRNLGPASYGFAASLHLSGRGEVPGQRIEAEFPVADASGIFGHPGGPAFHGAVMPQAEWLESRP